MCTNPITLRQKFGNIYRERLVPCGNCPECLKKKQSAYVCRCIEEAKKLGRVWFITLTYSDDNCPICISDGISYKSLRREDVKKWKREVRRDYFKKNRVPFPSFSFLICGEYGSRTHRPHYHGFLCGLDLKYAQILEKYWQDHYGFTVFKQINLLPTSHDDISSVARYVAKYCVKPDPLKNKLKGIVESPRIMTSIGFGLPENFEKYKDYMRCGLDLNVKKFTLAQVKNINDRCKYTYNGCDYSLPLYLRKKIFYEKNFKGNLSASPLQKLCTSALRSNDFEDLCRKLRELETSISEREASEIIASYISSQDLSLESRRNVATKNLLTYYKKDHF